MTILKKYWLTYCFCSLGLISIITFNIIGSHIDEAGILREPFGLIPLFWLLQLLGALVFLITFYRYRNKE